MVANQKLMKGDLDSVRWQESTSTSRNRQTRDGCSRDETETDEEEVVDY